MTRLIAGLCACLGIGLFFSGCAAPANPLAMVPPSIAPSSHHAAGDLAIAVSGGRDTSKMGASQISNEDFGTALVNSIEKTQIFPKVGFGQPGRYQLSAYIAKMTQPLMGFSMTVSMEVAYTLTDSKSGKSIWQKDIVSEHTAAVSEAFAGIKRLRLATEGAAQQNIESLIRELEQISF